jgi:hypothetical protein
MYGCDAQPAAPHSLSTCGRLIGAAAQRWQASSRLCPAYCVCFASRLVDLATTDKLIANELSGGQTPSSATKGVKEIKDYCSQQLQK